MPRKEHLFVIPDFGISVRNGKSLPLCSSL